MEAVIQILQDDSLKLGKPVKYLKKKESVVHQVFLGGFVLVLIFFCFLFFNIFYSWKRHME